MLDRRRFLSMLSYSLLIGGFASACTERYKKAPINVPEGQSLARFPEKSELIMLTDRPPQLETPLFNFRQDLTPNEAFFVRWHLEGIPTRVDLDSFRLVIDGHVEKTLSLSLPELKDQFARVTVLAVCQCSGNSRRFFEPAVPGGQWQNGAVGNARFSGVRLSDLLKKAGLKTGAVEASFAGLDEAPLSNMPKFVKSLLLQDALQDQVIVAYEMNGEPLPMLNGYPLRLIVPGWFATYWVKSLAHINVLSEKFDGFWMEKSYRIPDNEFAEESPDKLAKTTVAITKMNVRSFFVRPDPVSDELKAGSEFVIEGLAFDCGSGIAKVEVSIAKADDRDGDRGITKRGGSSERDLSNEHSGSIKQREIDSHIESDDYKEAKIEKNDYGPYSWCRWRLKWTPPEAGTYLLKARASSNSGETQPASQRWNKSGYMRNQIEILPVRVT